MNDQTTTEQAVSEEAVLARFNDGRTVEATPAFEQTAEDRGEGDEIVST